jgi:hypothetical protein
MQKSAVLGFAVARRTASDYSTVGADDLASNPARVIRRQEPD